MTYLDHYGRLWHETDHGTLTTPDPQASLFERTDR